MSIFRKIHLVLCFLPCLMTNLSALELGNEFNLSGGYRNDDISINSKVFLPTEDTIKDHLHFDNLDIGEIGFNFRLTMPEYDYCNSGNASLVNEVISSFYFKGSAYWGWSGKDNFDRNVGTVSPDDFVSTFSVSQGNDRARTEDFNIGLGCLLFNCDCWGIGLTGGYAYDKQRIRTSSGETSLDNTPFIPNTLYSGLVFKQRWQGPWVGAELFYGDCSWYACLGYEYHFAHYHAKLSLPNETTFETGDFSNTRSTRNAHGNIGYINAHYIICDCWQVGLGLTYKQYRARHGSLSPTEGNFEDIGFTSTTRGSSNAKWLTYSLVADVGYRF